MATMGQCAINTPNFWPWAGSAEQMEGKRSDILLQRYETLLRVSKCLTSPHEDLVGRIAAELRPVVDFDLLDIVINPPASSVGTAADDCQELLDGDGKCQCSVPLISRGAVLGFLVVGRFEENGFGQDEVELLTQVAGQVAIVVDNSLAYRHIAQLTEKLSSENIYFDQELPSE